MPPIARAVVLAACIAQGSASIRAQEIVAAPETVFRSDLQLIRLDISVLDRNGAPIHGLTAADFTIRDQGKVQPIVAFDAVDLPETTTAVAPWTRDMASGVSTNVLTERRAIVILMKDVLVPLASIADAKRIARGVVDEMGPHDMAAVVYVFNRNKGQEFTADRAKLRAAIDRFSIAFGDPGRTVNPMAASERGPQKADDPGLERIKKMGPAPEVCPSDSCVTMALQNAGDILGESPGGRKLIVLVSPRLRAGVGELLGPARNDGQKMLAAMQRANATLYQFDTTGLTVAAPHQVPDPGQTLADETGGRTIAGTNTPWTQVEPMFRENASYYLIGVRANDNTQGGQLHRLDVRVNRPGAEVRGRRGYYTPATRGTNTSNKEIPSALDLAIARGLPTGDLPVELTVAPFAVAGTRLGAVAIVAGLDAAPMTPRAGFDVVATAFRDDWKPAGSVRQQIEIAPLESSERPAHYDIASRLDLPPGRYEIRVALENRVTTQTGSVYASVTIPDFEKEPLVLSGLILERAPATQRGSGRDALGGLLPLAPTTIRTFAGTDRVHGLVRIYQGGSKAPRAASISIRIVDSAGRAAFERDSAVAPESFRAGRASDFGFGLPIEQLDPGDYLLSVEAVMGAQRVRREAQFAVH